MCLSVKTSSCYLHFGVFTKYAPSACICCKQFYHYKNKTFIVLLTIRNLFPKNVIHLIVGTIISIGQTHYI